MSDFDFDLVAAELRADRTDLDAYVEALAAKLEGALPQQTTVERGRTSFRGPKRVDRIETLLGDCKYILDRGDMVTTRCAHVVRNVVLKNDEVPLEEWLDRLARDLVAHAEATDHGREALERLLKS